MACLYITIDEAKQIHKMTVEHSGGGELGILDLGALDAVLTHIQNDDYYPDIYDKITHLFYCACQFHCFVDGNKRIALTLTTQFLLKNGYYTIAKDFMADMENIVYHVAAGKIKKDLLREIMQLILEGTYRANEQIKLKILNAIEG